MLLLNKKTFLASSFVVRTPLSFPIHHCILGNFIQRKYFHHSEILYQDPKWRFEIFSSNCDFIHSFHIQSLAKSIRISPNFQNRVFCKAPFPLSWSSKVGLNSVMTKLHKSTVSKMSLIQPVKFRTWEMGLFKMSHYETLHFQTGVF